MPQEIQTPENLHLTLTAKWFDMILEGKKPEEYRVTKPYWFRRLVFNPKLVCKMFKKDYSLLSEQDIADLIKRPLFLQMCPFVPYKTITFRNGYGNNVREMVVECKDIKFRTGNPAWGAEPEQVYFTIEVGKVLSTNNL